MGRRSMRAAADRYFHLADRLSGARERIGRKIYIRAKGYDNPAFDRALVSVQSDPSWRCHEVDCGHDVMIDMPDHLSELLLQAAA